jgi:hypothetical protein
MATFRELTDQQLQALGTRLIRNVQARVSKQVPTPARNPFSKGALARSIQYSWNKNAQDNWEMKIHYEDQGKFTNFGTRANRSIAMEETSVFGYSYRGYNRGKGGIRPQGWLSLRGDQPVYEAIVEAEVRIAWETFVNNTMTPLTKSK